LLQQAQTSPAEAAVKVERDIEVCNLQGLHARPAMQLVDLANGFASTITLRRDGVDGTDPTVADAKSVMAVITLAATRGTRLHLVADGLDAEHAADEIAKLFSGRFGEGE
jgi:phosphocarrier protein